MTDYKSCSIVDLIRRVVRDADAILKLRKLFCVDNNTPILLHEFLLYLRGWLIVDEAEPGIYPLLMIKKLADTDDYLRENLAWAWLLEGKGKGVF